MPSRWWHFAIHRVAAAFINNHSSDWRRDSLTPDEALDALADAAWNTTMRSIIYLSWTIQRNRPQPPRRANGVRVFGFIRFISLISLFRGELRSIDPPAATTDNTSSSHVYYFLCESFNLIFLAVLLPHANFDNSFRRHLFIRWFFSTFPFRSCKTFVSRFNVNFHYKQICSHLDSKSRISVFAMAMW